MGRAVEYSSRGTLSEMCCASLPIDFGALSTARGRAESATAGKTSRIVRMFAMREKFCGHRYSLLVSFSSWPLYRCLSTTNLQRSTSATHLTANRKSVFSKSVQTPTGAVQTEE